MRILIDADGCPVVNETIKVAHKFNLESIIFCDTSHNFDQKNVKVIVVSKILALWRRLLYFYSRNIHGF